MSKTFYYDNIEGKNISYNKLLNDLSNTNSYSTYCRSNSYYSIFKHIILSLITGKEIILLDNDFSQEEIHKLIGYNKNIFNIKSIDPIGQINFNDIIDKIKLNGATCKLTLFTSGTTGMPKKISHNFDSLSRFVKKEESRKNDIWGFAYNPTHMAGLQVFFQALLNQNTIVRLFGVERVTSLNLINEFKITNISATPTFYRLLLPADHICNSVRNLTSGGEKFDFRTLKKVKQMFPKCRVRNVYASTEAGTIFASEGEEFTIKSDTSHLIKIIEDELYIHESLIGESESLVTVDGWYPTGDMISVVSENPYLFRFISRKNESINSGGYKINPSEVEDIIRSFDGVIDVYVFAKKNSILGNIICCQVVSSNKFLTEKRLRLLLKDKLQEFKIPRLITFVKSIKTSRTGKLLRKN